MDARPVTSIWPLLITDPAASGPGTQTWPQVAVQAITLLKGKIFPMLRMGSITQGC